MESSKYPICQVIPTCQGEGSNVGKPSLLIRFDQCNLNCPWCDTKWAKSKNIKNELNISDQYFEDILFYINLCCSEFKTLDLKNLMITGGEPFLFYEIVLYIIKNIKKLIFNIETIEIQTNGTLLRLDVLEKLKLTNFKNIKLNISPKLFTNCYNNIFITELEIYTIYKDIFENITTIVQKQCYYNNYATNCNDLDFEIHFVYRKDWKESILNFYNKCIPLFLKSNIKIYVLPFTPNNIESETFENSFKTYCKETMMFCLENGFNFSLRDHIILFKTSNDECLSLV